MKSSSKQSIRNKGRVTFMFPTVTKLSVTVSRKNQKVIKDIVKNTLNSNLCLEGHFLFPI